MTEYDDSNYYVRRSRSWKVPFLAVCFILTIVGCALKWHTNDDSFDGQQRKVRNYYTVLIFLIPLFVLLAHYTKRPYPWLVAFGIWFWVSPFPMADADYLDDVPDRDSDDRKQTAGVILMLVGAGLSLLCFPWPMHRYDDRVRDRTAANRTTATTDYADRTVTTDVPPGSTAVGVEKDRMGLRKAPYSSWSPFSGASLLISLVVLVGCVIFWDLIRRFDYPYYTSNEFQISIRCLWVVFIFLMADMGSRSAQILTPFLAGFMLLSLTYALDVPDDVDRSTERKAAGSICFIGLALIILYDLYWMTVKDDDLEASDFYYGYHHRPEVTV